jgi:hypothetical protein
MTMPLLNRNSFRVAGMQMADEVKVALEVMT